MTPPLPTVLNRLYELVPRGALLGLDRVRAAAHALGDVHKIGTYVHVTGTNGKGSTAAFVATMARVAGARVGLYTSPHLCRFSERICIDGQPIDNDLLAHALHKALSVSAELTFFEVSTLAALIAFQESKVDLHVLEVGLGGRLDATNVVEGPHSISVITRVAFDHMDRLGSSLAAIAYEKAGIMRPGAPCVTGRLHPDAVAIVERVASELGSFVHEATSEEDSRFVDLHPPALLGVFQRSNAMIAVATGRLLGLPPPSVAEGLGSTSWPGRCEVLETPEGYVLLDCAHNPDAALALKNSLLGLGASFSRRHVALVFGVMADKNWRAMLDRLSMVTGPRVYVEPASAGRESARAEDLSGYMNGDIALSIPEALRIARQQVGRAGLVLVCGSIFLVGHARAHLLELPMDPHVGM